MENFTISLSELEFLKGIGSSLLHDIIDKMKEIINIDDKVIITEDIKIITDDIQVHKALNHTFEDINNLNTWLKEKNITKSKEINGLFKIG